MRGCCLCPTPREGWQGPESFRRTTLDEMQIASAACESLSALMPCDPILFLSLLVAQETVYLSLRQQPPPAVPSFCHM